ncbi:MAG TPA: cyclase family protein [Herpetosiphonaceae bacterium]
MGRLIDISVAVSNDLPTWPGDPSVSLEREAKIEEGSAANVSRLNAGVHTGTHVDAPLHFIPDDIAVHELELERFVGPCQVVELAGSGRISAEELERAGVAPGTERLLLKTANSAHWAERPLRFHTEFRALDSSAARWVVERGLRLIGIDYLSIESFEAEEHNPTHQILLGARVAVLEGLDLSQAAPGAYRLLCLPLKLQGSDGAPARAVLEEI